MSPLITYLLIAAFSLSALVVLVEVFVTKDLKRFVVQAAALGILFLVLHYVTGFPTPRELFGGASLLGAIGLMFLCVVLGMAARYAFYLHGRFSWRSLLKPLCVSPIVLLPLLGSIQTIAEIQAMHLVSFGILAFQNGFFWQVVFERAATKA